MSLSHQRLTSTEHLTVGFISLGCPKNRVDSQIMADALLADGIRLAPSPEEADVIIINTCAFIEDARAESVEAIQSACLLKSEGRCRAILVAGCLSQRYRDELRKSLPDVDGFIGLDELQKVAAVARRLGHGEAGIVDISDTAQRLFEPTQPGVVFSTGSYAYVKIAEGCNHRCTFCAIPAIRGASRSRSMEAVVREAESLLDRGFRELDLISQDVTSYGRDRTDGSDLPGLLRALGRLRGEFWIRLLYGYPSHVTDALLEAMAGTPSVCRYLDLPIQHSHPAILKAMGRAETVIPVQELATRIRRALPGAVLRTTCLVGFPGETQEHFEHLLAFVKDAEFDHLGAFVFSPEEGTAAFGMPELPARDVAEERRDRLMQTQQTIVDRKAASLVGTEDRVLLERPVAGKQAVWRGRSYRQAPEVDGDVFVKGASRDAQPGGFVRVRYTAAAGYDMKAAVIQE